MIIDQNGAAIETWRAGVTTRMRVSAQTGAHQLCIFEQWCEPGVGAPIHRHAVEEALDVLAGTARIAVGDTTVTVGANQTVVIPAGRLHGFVNAGSDILHVRATLAAASFEASYETGNELARRYLPQD